MTDNQNPDFVYRLVTPGEWFTTIETSVAPTRDVDKQDGYIHLSTRDQALETARLHLSHEQALLALEIPTAIIADQLRFELAPKRGEKFPHLYGALRHEHVARAIRLDRVGDRFVFGEPV